MKGFCLEVWGDYACFTRPEMKVERVSYDVITPSAARAIFEAILWKPAIHWRVTRVDVLAPLRWASVRRNEVGRIASPTNRDGFFIEDERQQRAGILLRDVKYRLHAEFDFIPPSERPAVRNPLPDGWREPEERHSPGLDEKPEKYAAMFARRADRGQTFTQPYLGCREFSCAFRRVDPAERIPVPDGWEGERDLGWMLYDMRYDDPESPTPMFFRARAVDGVLNIPAWDSEEVHG